VIVHAESHSLLLRSKDPARIKQFITKHRDIDYEGHNIAVRHGLDEVRVLRNLGVNAPPPILHYYDWPCPAGRTPFAHQKQTAAFATLHPRCFILNEPGTAKTAAVLWAADYLMKIGAVRKVLIAAPLSTLDLVWKQEIFDHLMHRTAAVLHGSRQKRLDLLAKPFDFYIVNHHGIEIVRQDILGRSDIDLIIVDECAEYRNASTDMYEYLCRVIGKRRLWMVTGTPCPQAPTDAWSQARLVNKSRVPEYFSQWKRQTMMQLTTHKWVPLAGSHEMAYEVLQPGIRFKKKDCLDLPPVLYEKRSVELSKAQKQAYTQMRNEMILMGDGHTITAVNAADRIGKLRQILCGAVKDKGTGNYIEIDHKPRVEVLLDTIRQAAAKVIVIVPFKGIIALLQRDLEKHYSCAVINGDVSKTRRDEIITCFKREADPHALLCHPKVMAHGLNLTEADMTIFYAPIYSNNDDQQVIERFNRPGQTRKMTIVQLGAMPLEWGIYQQVNQSKITQENILSLYRNEVLGIHS
jgi:SNF2 family DNA or RNA helicase